jgi:hypothetical protein
MLPYQVLPAIRTTDPVDLEDVEAAMLEQGASQLNQEDGLQLAVRHTGRGRGVPVAAD